MSLRSCLLILMGFGFDLNVIMNKQDYSHFWNIMGR